MQFENVSILSVAYEDAPLRLSSSELENQLLNTLVKLDQPQDVIQSLTGILARHLWEPNTQPSEAATRAGLKALQDANLEHHKIGVLINTSVCRDYIEPSVACLVHGNLSLNSNCLNFDVSNACLGFMDGMQLIANMIDRKQIDFGLLVDAESSRTIIESTVQRLLKPDVDLTLFRDHFASLTLGSGAVAMVLARSDLAEDGHKINGRVTLAASEHNRLCQGHADSMVTDSRALLIAGIALARKTMGQAVREFKWDRKAIDAFVLHQVSSKHTAKLIEALELEDSKTYKLYPEFGNIGPASLPIALAKAVEAGEINRGARVALMGIGSGINCSMMEVIW